MSGGGVRGRDLRDAQRAVQNAAFGGYIRELRTQRGWTQEQLAESSGLAVDTIKRLERGTFSPSLHTVCKLAGALGLLLSDLFYGFETRDVGRAGG